MALCGSQAELAQLAVGNFAGLDWQSDSAVMLNEDISVRTQYFPAEYAPDYGPIHHDKLLENNET